MPKGQNSDVFALIKSLSKAEKRFFKLFYPYDEEKEQPYYLQLFSVLDKKQSYHSDEDGELIPGLSNTQINNTKRHLHQAILRAMRQFQIKHRTDLYISENIDYARILYSKGLYIQSLRILEKLLPIAIQSEEPLLQLEIMEFEKYIEARHITRSRKVANKMEGLIERSRDMAEELQKTVILSNLSLDIHGQYIQYGFCKSADEQARIKDYFYSQINQIKFSNLSFTDRLYIAQSYMWYNYITQNISGVYRYALQWVNLFHSNSHMKSKDPMAYGRGMHYLILSCFYARDKKRHSQYLTTFKRFLTKNENEMEATSKMLSFVYQSNASLNQHILRGNYKKALSLEGEIHDNIKIYRRQLDTHRILLLYYKMAWIHFGVHNYDKALDYINQILQNNATHLRKELTNYSLLLQLVIHLDMGHFALSKYLLRAVRRAFKKTDLTSNTLELILTFIQNWLTHPDQKQEMSKTLIIDLDSLNTNSYDWRNYTYFNFMDWALSIRDNTTVEKAAKLRQ